MNTNETIYTLSEIKDIVRPVAERHHIRTLTLLGSYARGEADASSDIDLCVDGESIRSLLDLGDLYSDLEGALGKPIDLITLNSLKKHKEDPATKKLMINIERDNKLLYEEQ